jgi:hypothetical protein
MFGCYEWHRVVAWKLGHEFSWAGYGVCPIFVLVQYHPTRRVLRRVLMKGLHAGELFFGTLLQYSLPTPMTRLSGWSLPYSCQTLTPQTHKYCSYPDANLILKFYAFPSPPLSCRLLVQLSCLVVLIFKTHRPWYIIIPTISPYVTVSPIPTLLSYYLLALVAVLLVSESVSRGLLPPSSWLPCQSCSLTVDIQLEYYVCMKVPCSHHILGSLSQILQSEQLWSSRDVVNIPQSWWCHCPYSEIATKSQKLCIHYEGTVTTKACPYTLQSE